MDAVIGIILTKWPMAAMILQVLGGVVVMGYLYVKLTPTQDDDKMLIKLEEMPILGDLLQLLVKYSPIERKPKQ